MTKVWEEEDNKFLKEHYLTMSNQDLAERFGVSKKSIQGKLRRLGLHRNADDEKNFHNGDDLEQQLTESKEFRLHRKKLTIRHSSLKSAHAATPAIYVPRELTEKRKRAIRDFDNAMKIMQSGDKEKAIEEFDFIITTFKGEIDIINRASFYKSLLSTKPAPLPELNEPEDFYNAGIWCFNANKPDECLSYFEKALELDPEYMDAAYNIACLMSRKGNLEEAIRYLRLVLDNNDSVAETVINDEDFEKYFEDELFIEFLKEYIKS